MKIQTLSVVIGTRACNAACPFCVSHMTGFDEMPARGAIYLPNFEKTCDLAKLAGTTTVLMTGKGEPTLYPEEITEYLALLKPWRFPLIELQTNALDIGWLARDGFARTSKKLTVEVLKQWRAMGLNTIAISVVSEKPEHNTDVYLNRSRYKDYPDLATTIRFLHDLGFTVRLCVMMQQGAVDSYERAMEVIRFCKEHGVDQLTMRPIRKTSAPTQDEDASAYVRSYGLNDDKVVDIRSRISARNRKLMTLMHGAEVFDVDGQNLCLSDCLTVDARSDDIRTLIFYSDGRLDYDWQYDGAVILRGVPDAVRAAQPLLQIGEPNAA